MNIAKIPFSALSDRIRKHFVPYSDEFVKGGTVIGMYKHKNWEYVIFVGGDMHTLCIGATRSGKSRTVVLESIGLQALAGENLVCSDPKGELYQYTYPFLERLGYKVLTLDFKNPLKSSRYNFLQTVIEYVNQGDIPKAIEATWDITAALVPEDSHGERIWSDGEASIIAAAIMAVVYDNKDKPEYQNLTNVYYFISEMCKAGDSELPLNKYVKGLKEDHPARALLGISQVAPSKTRGSFFTAALTTLRLFTNPYVCDMTAISDFTAEEICSGKTALFIILPDEKVTYYSLASLFINQLYERLVKIADDRGGRLKNRINFNLDEFGNFMKIPAFSNKLTVGGGRGIRFNLYLQDFAQLEEKYGRESYPTIISNCHVWVYLQSDGPETQKLISEKLGNYTVASSSQSTQYSGIGISPGNMTSSSNLTARPLLTPDEVGKIKRPYSLVTSREYPAMLNAPDLSKWYFNQMFGLGDPEHNRKVREEREKRRPVRTCDGKMKLWGVWDKFSGSGMALGMGMPSSRTSIRNNIHGTQTIPPDILKPTGKVGIIDEKDEIDQFVKKQD